MKKLIRLEEVAMFGLSIYLFNTTSFAWWWYLLLILTPDISMVGYAFGSRAGAISYNVFHHKGLAIVLMCMGWISGAPWVLLSGIILFGHSSMDRMFGYGLKYDDSFHNTHLGFIGRVKRG